jgi:hypothetical protein
MTMQAATAAEVYRPIDGDKASKTAIFTELQHGLAVLVRQAMLTAW